MTRIASDPANRRRRRMEDSTLTGIIGSSRLKEILRKETIRQVEDRHERVGTVENASGITPPMPR